MAFATTGFTKTTLASWLLCLLTIPSTLAQQRPAPPPGQPRPADPAPPVSALDEELRELISNLSLEPIDPASLALPNINDPVAQLGKRLFFAKNLGGEGSVACVSCHHPALGGGDGLSLSVGVDAVDMFDHSSSDLLGQGRFQGEQEHNLPLVPRNAPTVFNLGLQERNMFWDGRIERLPDGTISTPDSGAGQPDTNLAQDATLASAQARFPVTSVEEMRGEFLPGIDNQTLREALSERFDNSLPDFFSQWPLAFERAYGDQEVSVDRISHALGEYQRSMLFVNNPWQAYLRGDNKAISDSQKRGALLFFRFGSQGGASCLACHNGDTLSDGRFHLVAFPQIGNGKVEIDGLAADNGREAITGNEADQYLFRTPSLLNVSETGPYGHAGAYRRLEDVVRHYTGPGAAIDKLFAAKEGQPFMPENGEQVPFCKLPQIQDILQKTGQSCDALYPDAYASSVAAAERLEKARTGDAQSSSFLLFDTSLDDQQIKDLAAFLRAQTDPCVKDRRCLTPWIVEPKDRVAFPDDNPLIGHDRRGRAL
ncbi:cytochrome c peroxidase [Aliiglaciecola sp. CAU 1673]|uniref:cytochrome-c peroxidase n=1 Tax=Aliiglaciecola sp. CAU 1673 TaxID=3032595 RepID=UPI0023DB132E|nr:cytochrome c peroxidase [Aliiglaciecola sp. CAU 1673]MDF2180104.1 cytochrome c peroxidase [Aliiglaciecola sp. CAU 1673]